MRNIFGNAVFVSIVMLSVNVNADVLSSSGIRPDIDGTIVVWADGTSVVWDDIADANAPASISGLTSPAYPGVSGSKVIFEQGSPQDLNGFDTGDPSWLFPAAANNAAKQRYPVISGSRIVWQDYTDTATDPDIFMIDLSEPSPTPQTVCDHTARQIYPAIGGDTVVWMDNRSGLYQVYRCDVSSLPCTAAPVSTTTTAQWYPAVSGHLIVWAEDRGTGSDIYGYDTTAAQNPEFVICGDPGDQAYPAVCGDLIVWQDNHDTTDGGYDIRLYDRMTGQFQTVCDDAGNQWYPNISGRTVVWQNEGTGIGIAMLATPKDITLTAPTGGEMVLAGSTMGIAWMTDGPVEQVTIEFQPDSGGAWQVIEPNVPAEQVYHWNPVADVDSTDCRIRISDFDDSEVSDTLADSFTIFQCDENLTADITGDCFVGLDDFAEMAAQWITCGNPYDDTWCFD